MEVCILIIILLFIRSKYAYAEGDDAELLKIDYKMTKILFDEQIEDAKKLEMLTFLGDSIPGFKYRAKKEKFIKLFEKKVIINILMSRHTTQVMY